MLDAETKRRIDTCRDIFKNAYLPYLDPETLRVLLKKIGMSDCLPAHARTTFGQGGIVSSEEGVDARVLVVYDAHGISSLC